MAYATFSTPTSDRYFEDYQVGATYELGDYALTEAEIVDFARRFDPQRFHVDRVAAAESPYGGIIASGWHTASAMMRLLVDHFVSANAGLGSPGLDEIRWLKPVRPGAKLTVRVTVIDKRRSQSKPDRGLFFHKVEVVDATGDTVMTVRGAGMVRLREPTPALRIIE
jgi:acyl dehydratase